MHLNPDKVQIDCTAVPFFGNVLSKDGLSPDNSKVELIKQWPTPTNQKELQSFLYLSFRSMCTPAGTFEEFMWTPVHQHAFDQIKLHVSNDVKLQFYDSGRLVHGGGYQQKGH